MRSLKMKDVGSLPNSKNERLAIVLHEVHSDTAVELGEEPGLQKEGVEAELQPPNCRPHIDPAGRGLGSGVQLRQCRTSFVRAATTRSGPSPASG